MYQLICLVLLVPTLALAQSETPLADHVFLISIDGLRPEFYKDSSWPAPALQQMAAAGTYSDGVRTVFPSVTYPSHTTIITGALPAKHGIYYNSPFEPGGQTGRWYWEAESIRVPTLWNAAQQKGLVSASIGWPVSVNAAIDYNVPEIWSLSRDEEPLTPMRKFARPPGFFEQLENNATGKLTSATFGLDYLTREDNVAAMAEYIIKTYKPHFFTIHLIGADHFQHEEGRDGKMVRRAVSAVDRAVAAISEAAERAGILGRTAFIITGDHGFIDIHTQLAPNRWLADAGLMAARKDRGDWRATFHTSAASAFLILRRQDDTETLARVRDVLENLPPAIKRLFRVVDRKELDEIGAAPQAALALAPEPGIYFTAQADKPAISATSGATHGFWPELPDMHTGYIGWGAGFKPGVVVPMMNLTDISPIVAALLGLDFDAPDGVLYPGLLQKPR